MRADTYPRAGDIGGGQREVEFEPLPATAPVTVPVPTPAPEVAPAEPDLVPA